MSATSTFGYTGLFSDPFFTGTSATSSEVPGRFHVALNGRGFMLDLASNEYRHESIPLLRQQADQSETPGEASVNPDDLWRRSATSWALGAGQRILDADDSTPGRFYASKGIDPWTTGQVSLLSDTAKVLDSAATNLAMVVAVSHLYVIDGSDLRFTTDDITDGPAFTDVTGLPSAATSITTDGYSVWTAHSASGIYATTPGAGGSAIDFTGTASGVEYLKGRLFAWHNGILYNPTTGPTIGTAILTHPNADFTWIGVAEANGFYFPAGFSGDRSTIYSTAVQADGTGLDVPVAAAELPDGEIVRSIQGYLGFLLIGTDKGIRFGIPNDSGDVELGGLIADATQVRCFEGQGSFVWFGWSQFDATSSGLGRMDLGAFNGTRPAFASDLMAEEVGGLGDVLSVVTFQDVQVFAISADGIHAPTVDKVASGTLTQGRITYGLADAKVSMFLSAAHEPLAGSISAELARDFGDYIAIGNESDAPGSVASTFRTNQGRGRSFDVRLTLARDATTTTTGPVLTSLTLRSYPAATRSERITVPLLIGRNQKDLLGRTISRDPVDDLAFLQGLEADSSPVSLQEGRITSSVVAEDHDWRLLSFETGGHPTGTYLARLKRFAEE